MQTNSVFLGRFLGKNKIQSVSAGIFFNLTKLKILYVSLQCSLVCAAELKLITSLFLQDCSRVKNKPPHTSPFFGGRQVIVLLRQCSKNSDKSKTTNTRTRQDTCGSA